MKLCTRSAGDLVSRPVEQMCAINQNGSCKLSEDVQPALRSPSPEAVICCSRPLSIGDCTSTKKALALGDYCHGAGSCRPRATGQLASIKEPIAQDNDWHGVPGGSELTIEGEGIAEPTRESGAIVPDPAVIS